MTQSRYKARAMCSLILGGATTWAGTATTAHAASLSSPLLIVAAGDNDGSCGISLTAGVTGTTEDGPTGSPDKVRAEMVFGNAMTFVPGQGGAIRSAPVGSTQTLNLTANAPSQPSPLSQIRVILRDINAANAPLSQLDIIDVPDALLANSPSPACRSLVALSNSPPTVNAGADRTVPAGSVVTLAATASDLENDPLTYLFEQTSGTPVGLSGSTTLTPSFTAPPKTGAAQTLIFSLIANDGTSNSVADSVSITIAADIEPNADAGPNAIAAGGSAVTLNGTASSDADNDPLTYAWVQTAGPSVTLIGANTATPSFVAPARTNAAQALTFALTVNDGILGSEPSSVTITVPDNAAPIANAGADAMVAANARITLEGTLTDPDNDPVAFVWTQVAGPNVPLAGSTTANPSFTSPPKTGAAQVLTFQLVGTDGTTFSAPDTVDITVAANSVPVANAGADATVNGGTTVALNGATSADSDGDPLTYIWVQTGGSAVTLSNATAASPTFVAPASAATLQTLTFDLVVSDGVSSSVADSVSVSVNPNAPPVANAGSDQGPVNTGQSVTLNGSASTDPDGNPLSYRWTQVSGPAATLVHPNSASPSFVAPPVQGTQNLVFQLVVNDGTVDSPPDTVTIAVRAVGTVTVIQRVVGADAAFTFTSDVSGLAGIVTTSNGAGQRSASLVPAGVHSLVAGDARTAGYALTNIVCNDTDSVTNLASRSIAIAISPNENLVCTFTSTNTRDAASVAIRNFLTARNAAILAAKPDLQRRLDRLAGTTPAGGTASAFGLPVPGSGFLPLSLTASKGQLKASASLGMLRAAAGDTERGSTPFDIWTEAYVSSISYPGHKGRFSMIYAGADYRASGTLLIGALAQFDRFSPKGAVVAGTVKGHGWMAGPYVMAKLAPHLYADMRATWGKSSNSVSPLGSFSDGFDTSRALYSGSLIGQFDIGKATQIRPEVSVRYLDERQKRYVDTLGVVIPGHSVGQGDISFRPRIHHQRTLSDGWTLRPFAEAEGIYTFGLDPVNALGGKFRMRVEGGTDLYSRNGIRAGVSAFYDGIGSNGYKSGGAHISFSVGF